ncbi:hypothetical protein E1180_02710 [Roseibium denhamense]|uniref:Uncharacterized protein n=1 Tax=Roseibium denhamense TaxID=76305 RepID=A0ABY1NWB7_9HYPH|nr:hypothetical protein [Roseibium denhamense]MTI04427.1 hypothetical protein [Roseibium denhamense]SMP19707.1 hypothetical protein SAMN06265374_2054 [Roseibium denhamense]
MPIRLKLTLLKKTLLAVAALGAAATAVPVSVTAAKAETFYCKSTKTPNGQAKYCNFLLFDRSFTRHKQIVVRRGARTNVAVNGRYDVFCVLVQDHRGVPTNIAYRKQQCQKTDTGRNYQFPIREMNMRKGRNGFSTDRTNAFAPQNRLRNTY